MPALDLSISSFRIEKFFVSNTSLILRCNISYIFIFASSYFIEKTALLSLLYHSNYLSSLLHPFC